MTAQDTVNLRAVEVANQALGQIAGHKDDCARRQTEILDKFAEIKTERMAQQIEFRAAIASMQLDVNTKFDKITDAMRRVAMWMVTSLIGACLYLLITYVFPRPIIPTHAAALISGLIGG